VKINDIEKKVIRARLNQPNFKPFIIFCDPKEMAPLVYATQFAAKFTIQEIISHGREVKPGLWAFVFAPKYDGTELRKILGLTTIGGTRVTKE
jgi:hypothetical protein